MTDFTNCPIVPGRAYNGANGSKIAVEYGGGIYMLKFPPSGERKPTNLSYTNSCISEHLASSIFNLIGISASPNRDALFLCPDFIGRIPIRKRNNRVVVHLNDAELSKLEQDTATAGMCREKYIRLALMGIIIHPRPPDNYGKVLQQLSAYGNNLNQIAHVVNATGRATAEQLDTALQILEKTWDYVEDTL